MGKNKKSDSFGVVFSTNPDYSYDNDDSEETLAPEDQQLKVLIDRKQRRGKEVTLVTGFVGDESDLKDLGKTLKTKCGVGGSAKDGEIIIQGNHLQKIKDILSKLGYRVK